MKSSILIIYTGGTIGMKNDAETGALVPFDFSGIYDEFPSLKRLNVDIDVLTMDPVIDSSNVTPAIWAALAELIRDNYPRYDGFVVLHGTDTMSYTASALSFMLENLAKPVVFTGSQIPIGVLRTDGRENLITLHTCGKALGAEGALLCAPAIVRDFLVNRGRPFIFSTAPSPLMAWLVHQALEIVANEPERAARLHGLVRHTETRLARLGLPASGSQIFPVVIGDNARTMRIAAALQADGFDIRGIRPPTVAPGTARLRIAITLNVGEREIDAMTERLSAAMAAA